MTDGDLCPEEDGCNACDLRRVLEKMFTPDQRMDQDLFVANLALVFGVLAEYVEIEQVDALPVMTFTEPQGGVH